MLVLGVLPGAGDGGAGMFHPFHFIQRLPHIKHIFQLLPLEAYSFMGSGNSLQDAWLHVALSLRYSELTVRGQVRGPDRR